MAYRILLGGLIFFWQFSIYPIVPPVFAEGRIQHHKIKSKILAEAGEVADRELSIYLPEEYAESDHRYPVLYLLHGYSGTNKTFLGEGYPYFGELVGKLHVNLILDRLIKYGMAEPMIAVFPNVRRETMLNVAYRSYLIKDVIQFVDLNYRTMKNREARAIAGHSYGGGDSIIMAISYPSMFSLVGSYSANFQKLKFVPSLFEKYDQELFPLRFWIYVGKKDEFRHILPVNMELVRLLKDRGIPSIYIEDDGNHWNRLGSRIRESILFFSKHFKNIDQAETMEKKD
jgi:enterochelin esterase-like enzyme